MIESIFIYNLIDGNKADWLSMKTFSYKQILQVTIYKQCHEIKNYKFWKITAKCLGIFGSSFFMNFN